MTDALSLHPRFCRIVRRAGAGRCGRIADALALDPRLLGAPAFTTCACGALVLEKVWVHGEGWRPLAVPVSPVRGDVHQCPPIEEPRHA